MEYLATIQRDKRRNVLGRGDPIKTPAMDAWLMEVKPKITTFEAIPIKTMTPKKENV